MSVVLAAAPLSAQGRSHLQACIQLRHARTRHQHVLGPHGRRVSASQEHLPRYVATLRLLVRHASRWGGQHSAAVAPGTGPRSSLAQARRERAARQQGSRHQPQLLDGLLASAQPARHQRLHQQQHQEQGVRPLGEDLRACHAEPQRLPPQGQRHGPPARTYSQRRGCAREHQRQPRQAAVPVLPAAPCGRLPPALGFHVGRGGLCSSLPRYLPQDAAPGGRQGGTQVRPQRHSGGLRAPRAQQPGAAVAPQCGSSAGYIRKQETHLHRAGVLRGGHSGRHVITEAQAHRGGESLCGFPADHGAALRPLQQHSARRHHPSQCDVPARQSPKQQQRCRGQRGRRTGHPASGPALREEAT
mmetsp:Transcript_19907/g.33551  ORF Transcript_19907/g.33551 Transcript_19907/m.33551 type:complete len:358 (+) Transcript_19907:1077-2150(+)